MVLRLLTCCRFGLLLLLSARCGSSGPESPAQIGLLHRRPDSPARANNFAKRLKHQGCVLRDVGEFDSAMVYFRRALELGEQYRLKERVYAALLGIAGTYAERPYYRSRFDYEADLDSAETYYQLAYALCRDSGMTRELPVVLCEMATSLQRDPDHYGRADSLFREALKLARLENSFADEGFILYHQGLLHLSRTSATTDPAGFRAAVGLVDSAAVLLRKTGRLQHAGAAEAIAEDCRARLARVAEKSGR